MVKAKHYINVTKADRLKVHKYVGSLPIHQQGRYRSLINALSNNFYGSCKSLNDNELAQYYSIVGAPSVFKFEKR